MTTYFSNKDFEPAGYDKFSRQKSMKDKRPKAKPKHKQDSRSISRTLSEAHKHLGEVAEEMYFETDPSPELRLRWQVCQEAVQDARTRLADYYDE